METKHTPGPWSVGDSIDGATVHNESELMVAFCRNLAFDLGECAANARLIAAAPELLEACQLALDSDDRGVKDVLRTALAKARGE